MGAHALIEVNAPILNWSRGWALVYFRSLMLIGWQLRNITTKYPILRIFTLLRSITFRSLSNSTNLICHSLSTIGIFAFEVLVYLEFGAPLALLTTWLLCPSSSQSWSLYVASNAPRIVIESGNWHFILVDQCRSWGKHRSIVWSFEYFELPWLRL